MTTSDILVDAFTRIRDGLERVATGRTADDLAYRPFPDANSAGWLLWHLTRVQDSHLADAAGNPQRWIEEGFVDAFALPFSPEATGYGQSSADVAALRVEPASLIEYHRAVYAATVAFVDSLDESAYARVVDLWRGEPVTLAVRLVSVIGDCLKHLGQAEYVCGLLPTA